ncbi:MAG: glycosyltransferase [Polyangiales bacterium]
MAGDGPASSELKALAETRGLTDEVVFHGIVRGRALDALFDRADIAVGSLAMHRIGLEQTSSLKNREYCARGIPFIAATDDVSFCDANFMLRVPEGEAPIDILSVMNASRDVLSDVVATARSMRQFAQTQLSWKKRMAEVLDVVGV